MTQALLTPVKCWISACDDEATHTIVSTGDDNGQWCDYHAKIMSFVAGNEFPCGCKTSISTGTIVRYCDIHSQENPPNE